MLNQAVGVLEVPSVLAKAVGGAYISAHFHACKFLDVYVFFVTVHTVFFEVSFAFSFTDFIVVFIVVRIVVRIVLFVAIANLLLEIIFTLLRFVTSEVIIFVKRDIVLLAAGDPRSERPLDGDI